MSAKLYREIMKFMKNQRDVLKTFENTKINCIMINSNDLGKLLKSLRYNLNLLETNINKLLDKEE